MGNSLQHQTMVELSHEEFQSLIQLFLDGEASQEQIVKIENKCECCSKSAAYYKDECTMFEIIRNNLNANPAPLDLANQIRGQIVQNPSV